MSTPTSFEWMPEFLDPIRERLDATDARLQASDDRLVLLEALASREPLPDGWTAEEERAFQALAEDVDTASWFQAQRDRNHPSPPIPD